MSSAIEGQVAVVTGGSRGIGRGVVAALAARKMRIVVNYRSDARAAEESCRVASSLGSPVAIAIPADVSDLEDGRRLIDASLASFGKIDLWVNNAGVAPLTRLDLLEATPESWDRVLGINLRGPFFLTQRVAREMVRLLGEGLVESPQIVFVTSVSSTFASINRGDYCVSKAGLSMVARLFAVRLAELGVRVYEVRPGVIATEMTGSVKELYDRRIADGLSPIRRWGSPEDVGKAIAAIAEGAFPFSTGEVIHVDGGLHLDRL